MNNITDSFAKISISLDKEFEDDWNHISNSKDKVLAGFLNIGKKDNWNQSEGGNHETGFRFTRCMLRKFWNDNEQRLGDYRDIFERVVKSFSPAARASGNQLYNPRSFIDTTVTGWMEHSVSRVVGWVGTKNTENGPFFEVLINSAKKGENPRTAPFKTIILSNKSSAEKRWNDLMVVQKHHCTIAYPRYYQSQELSPASFIELYLKDHGKSPGPNAVRLLEGLAFLNHKIMKAQTMGNCWMKQNIRQVLVTLFIETLTHRSELEVHKAWDLSKLLYRKWKKHTTQELENMMTSKGMCLDLVRLVQEKLQKKNRLLLTVRKF
jgi:hypothetical protein